MRRACHGLAALATGLALGCGKEPPPPFDVWSRPQALASNKPTALEAAAIEIERSVPPNLLDRTSFTPYREQLVVQKAGDTVARLRGARDLGTRFSPKRPFEQVPYHRGWRTLGRALAWRIKHNCGFERDDLAVSDTILAHRIGFALTDGDAQQATLGLAIADEARKAIAPSLTRLGSGQLRQLAQGVSSAVSNRPPSARMVDNELANMLLSVQHVQDLYRNGDLAQLRARLGTSARDTVRQLEALRSKDGAARQEYFRGFAGEAEKRARWLKAIAVLPASKRTKVPLLLAEARPWRKLAQHFFTAPEAYLAMLDATLARTRLLALHANALAAAKTTGATPRDLLALVSSASASKPHGHGLLTTDPYTGRSLVYKSAGAEFAIYSVGPDLRDDGGDTNASFTAPDLTLER